VPSWDDDDSGAVPYEGSASSSESSPSAHTSSGGS
jgi:hypothetical protein